jgi:hypothetical protein
MQGLSPEHLDGSQPLPTSTPEGLPIRRSPSCYSTTRGVQVTSQLSPPPQVERTDSLEDFRITNTREDYRIRRGERPFVRLNPSEEASCYIF